mmetsp:Transcript_62480/g.173170  ORF Transcript_62480/g.173170 Transcript_62480/m.173170 type:complete len:90 (-) Transcript_62480:130-399(-)
MPRLSLDFLELQAATFVVVSGHGWASAGSSHAHQFPNAHLRQRHLLMLLMGSSTAWCVHHCRSSSCHARDNEIQVQLHGASLRALGGSC